MATYEAFSWPIRQDDIDRPAPLHHKIGFFVTPGVGVMDYEKQGKINQRLARLRIPISNCLVCSVVRFDLSDEDLSSGYFGVFYNGMRLNEKTPWPFDNGARVRAFVDDKEGATVAQKSMNIILPPLSRFSLTGLRHPPEGLILPNPLQLPDNYGQLILRDCSTKSQPDLPEWAR